MSLSIPTVSIIPIRFSLRRPLSPLSATAAGNKFNPSPADDEPPEAPEDSSHGVSKLQQFDRQVSRAKKAQQAQFDKDQSLFLSALALEPDPPESPTGPNPPPSSSAGDDLFGDVDTAIALKRQEFVSKGLLKPNPAKMEPPLDGIDELSAEEVVDLEEIKELQGLTVISEEDRGDEEVMESNSGDFDSNGSVKLSSFDVNLDALESSRARIVDPKFRMTLAELLDESRVVPVSVYGDLEVVITGIQHDSREVNAGDLFVCCEGRNTDGHAYLTEADKRGAVAVVADMEINIDETLGCKALVIVEDTSLVLPLLAVSFYKHPSRSLSAIGVTGTNGKTMTTHLVKAMYEAMGLRTGMLGTLGYYIHGDNKVDAPNTTLDVVSVQRLMAKMVHDGTEAVVMEASSHGLALGRCDEIDFDIAVFTNLTRDHLDFHGTEEEYKNSMAKLFAKMVDPERHPKVVNIDDPNAPYFIAQGNPNVPVVTYAIDDKNADVHPLKFELSLFETQLQLGLQ